MNEFENNYPIPESAGHREPEVEKEKTGTMIELIKNQWIPDIEKMIPDVMDADMKKGFEMELAGIKTDFEELENTNFTDEEIKKKVKAVYDHAEDLFGKVALCIEKK